MDPAAALERIVRDSYGRLVAWLARRCGDLQTAEDALADAMAEALARWPADGVPARPESWLLTAAHRRLIDEHRHRRIRAEHAPRIAALLAAQRSAGPVADERLGLLFACAHPALAAEVHAPLMLQAVLGLDAARIAAAFLVSPATMGQRLVRAKARIRDAGIPLAPPDEEQWPERLPAVQAAIYAAFGSGRGELAREAVDLARMLAALVPDDAETGGLAALLLHVSARLPAQRDAAGAFVPLDGQDPATWDGGLIDEAEGLLRRAAAHGRPGRYQWEAAIQSVHAGRRRGVAVDWAMVVELYAALLAVAPTVGAALGQVAAIRQTAGAERALAVLDELGALPPDHQPAWALRARLLQDLGRTGEAEAAYRRAAALADDPAVRAWLLTRIPESTP